MSELYSRTRACRKAIAAAEGVRHLRLLDVPVPSIYGPSADEGKIG